MNHGYTCIYIMGCVCTIRKAVSEHVRDQLQRRVVMMLVIKTWQHSVQAFSLQNHNSVMCENNIMMCRL